LSKARSAIVSTELFTSGSPKLPTSAPAPLLGFTVIRLPGDAAELGVVAPYSTPLSGFCARPVTANPIGPIEAVGGR